MEPDRRHTVAVLLAAGSGSRFAGPTHKLLAPLRRTPGGPHIPVVAHALKAMLEAVTAPDSPFVGAVVIDGAIDLTALVDSTQLDAVTSDRAHSDPGAADVEVLHNDLWQSGQRSSVRLAIEAARQRGCTQVVIGLGDQPFVSPLAWTRLAHADAAIAVAVYGAEPDTEHLRHPEHRKHPEHPRRPEHPRHRGNPVKLRDDVWQFLDTDTGDPDSGARSLISQRPELVVEVPCPGDDHDIDTLEDVPTWNH